VVDLFFFQIYEFVLATNNISFDRVLINENFCFLLTVDVFERKLSLFSNNDFTIN